MTSDEYWHGDVKLTEAYREAEIIRRDNQLYHEMRSGRYVYEALLAASPAFREWSKGIRHEYPTEPVFTLSDDNEGRERQWEKEQMDKNKAFMNEFALNHNAMIKGE